MSDAPHVVVTGAAGAIGSAFARAYRARHAGARFSLVDVDMAGAATVARMLGAEAHAESWDLAEPDTLPDRVGELVARRGPIDVLVNCAGVMDVRALCSTEWAIASRLLRIDLESPLRLMALVAPSMRARRRGVIVNVSSMAGVTPLRGCAFYGAAKAGLAMASEIARIELATFGVHVVTVYPGPVHSELERRARAQLPATAITRWLPTGKAEPLAARMVDACERRRARVVYPALYDLASWFPALAGKTTAALSPMPKESSSAAPA